MRTHGHRWANMDFSEWCWSNTVSPVAFLCSCQGLLWLEAGDIFIIKPGFSLGAGEGGRVIKLETLTMFRLPCGTYTELAPFAPLCPIQDDSEGIKTTTKAKGNGCQIRKDKSVWGRRTVSDRFSSLPWNTLSNELYRKEKVFIAHSFASSSPRLGESLGVTSGKGGGWLWCRVGVGRIAQWA